MNSLRNVGAAALIAFACTPAHAAEVRLRGNLAASCILSLGTEGRLAISQDGTTLGSEEPTGIPATLTVLAVGGTPSVQFTAPTADGPSGTLTGATAAIRYVSLGGSNQPYTSAASTGANVRLLDTITVHGRVVRPAGFEAGNYLVRTTATCQQ